MVDTSHIELRVKLSSMQFRISEFIGKNLSKDLIIKSIEKAFKEFNIEEEINKIALNELRGIIFNTINKLFVMQS